MDRRELLALGSSLLVRAAWPAWARTRDELHADVVIVGGGLGGVAAALAATRRGLRVVMTEPTDWIGGQLTSQGVPPDENRWIEEAGSTAGYRALRKAIRDRYRRTTPLTEAARSRPRLNPGAGWVSRLCVEPAIAHAVLLEQLAPALEAGQLALLLEHRPVSAETDGDRVTAVRVEGPSGERILRGPWFLDATEEGDLYPLAGVEHRIGAEAREETGEPNARAQAEPDTLQAPTWCAAIAYDPGVDHRQSRVGQSGDSDGDRRRSETAPADQFSQRRARAWLSL